MEFAQLHQARRTANHPRIGPPGVRNASRNNQLYARFVVFIRPSDVGNHCGDARPPDSQLERASVGGRFVFDPLRQYGS